MGYFDDPKFFQDDAGGQSAPGYFDDPKFQQKPKSTFNVNAEKTFAEKYIAPLLEPVFNSAGWGNNGLDARSILTKGAGTAVGAAQLAANVASPILAKDSQGRSIGENVNSWVQQKEREYNDYRALGGGGTGSEIVGALIDPTNAVMAAKIPAAASTLGRIGAGFATGALGGALQSEGDQGNYWDQKNQSIVAGGAAGAILTPVLGKVADRAVRYFGRGVDPSRLSNEAVDASISASLKEAGQNIADVPPQQLDAIRKQVAESLAGGTQLDAAALSRKADFEALGIDPLLGQLTRDPAQFAFEQNIRGKTGAGEKILARLSDQNNKLMGQLSVPAQGVQDAYNAGNTISASLKNLDDNVLRPHVTGLYNEARQSAGKDFEVPLQGLAQDYARVLSDFGDKVPGPIRSRMASFGLDPANPGNQTKLFTIEDADKLLKLINQHDPGFSDPVTGKALTDLRNAVKGSVNAVDGTGGVFAPAVKAASERFKMMDAVPALKAASEGSVAPDDFVRKFIINGKTNDVKGLANTLKASDPAAWQEARAQIAEELRMAGFGHNTTQSGSFAQDRYMQKIRQLGVDKIGAFFNASEVDNLMRVGRVGALIKQAPNASTVNTSNTAVAASNLLGKFGGSVGAVANTVVSPVKNYLAVNKSLAAQLPGTQAPLNVTQNDLLRFILAGGALGGGAFAGGSVGK